MAYNTSLRYVFLSFCILYFTSFSSLKAQSSPSEVASVPYIMVKEPIYADIDTVSQSIYLNVRNELWKYSLASDNWEFLSTLDLSVFDGRSEFAYDHSQNRLLFWSRGVGLVYSYDLKTKSLSRVDQSFNHKNQYGHLAFLRNGTIYAFGGYGFWDWHNMLTYFNPELAEWSIVNINRESSLPEGRVGFTGIYAPDKDQFFTYGGFTSESDFLDDQHFKRKKLTDIWAFDFPSKSWSHLSDDLSPGYSMIGSSPTPVRSTAGNIMSKSTYSPNSGIWYIPVDIFGNSHRLFLQPINTNEFQKYEPLEIYEDQDAEFVILNYLFNTKNSELIFVTVPRLTNSNKYNIEIKRLGEKDLLSRIESQKKSKLVIQAGIAGAAVVFILLIFYFLNRRYSEEEVTNKLDIDPTALLLTKMNELELDLIKAIQTLGNNCDSSELEEFVWPEVKNFDYRRKLRNETINTINKKFREHTGKTKNLIVRQKDPNDNRRYMYGLNPEIEL